MADPRKIIYVDFVEKKKAKPFAFGGGPRLTVGVFFACLLAQVGFAAFYLPQWLTSGFFGPTVIAVSVILALGVKKAIIRRQVSLLHKSMLQAERRGAGGRTLH